MTSWIEICEERLTANYRAIQDAVDAEAAVLAVVKANAYGHGLEQCSLILARAGAPWLGVTSAAEGALVRRALAESGVAQPDQPAILVMCGFLREDVETIARHALTPVVWMQEHIEWLQGSGLAVHVEVDTGMARQGVPPGRQLDDLLDQLTAAGLSLDGVMTHFSAAEVAHSPLTLIQQHRFETAIAQVRSKRLSPKWVHAGSSSSVDNPAQSAPWLVNLASSIGARAMVRCGIALYGYCSQIEQQPTLSPLTAGHGHLPSRLRPALHPVMTWKTRIVSLRDLAAGETVGYNATFTAPAATRLAMLPVGYADGLRRELSSSNDHPGGWVVLHTDDGSGRQSEPQTPYRAPIVGRVSMNLTMVDVTAFPGVRIGDEVVLLGDGITADDHARLADTIPYEILCAIRGVSRLIRSANIAPASPSIDVTAQDGPPILGQAFLNV
jgi:alanine racemase